jgi:formate-dependent nitrite reductase cytochrome c552 subunit
MSLNVKRWIVAGLSFLLLVSLLIVAYRESQRKLVEERQIAIITADSRACVDCHKNDSPALVKEWEYSKHARVGIGCVECHAADRNDIDAWKHEGVYISALVTPLDCAECHEKEYKEFSNSPHAKAATLIYNPSNVPAVEKIKLDGQNGISNTARTCQECHGSIIKFARDEVGHIVRTGSQKKPFIDPETWPNSGMGRFNPDGSKGSCHACHARHAFQSELSRSPETCGKCHMGLDYPQLEVYKESKHGIAFSANRERMDLDKRGEWVLGRDYSAAPTCATCHISSYLSAQGFVEGGSHDVGERISWTLLPAISTKVNLVIYEDGYKENYPETSEPPSIGDEITTIETVVENEKVLNKEVRRTVKDVIYSDDRREKMIGVCLNCHNDTYVDNFYDQFDKFIELYNEKFAEPAQNLMDTLQADGVINQKASFEKEVQWAFWDLWHHGSRQARHGAAMMGPSITRQGMYEVSETFYSRFLPAVISAAAEKSPEMEQKYRKKVNEVLSRPEHKRNRELKQ